MSNWAKLQEELTGLPVHKRARHGIHFDKGGGEIVANFSGAPCHYLEKGLWKPIDTTPILLPDGWYGCAHSKVRVHPDGRVKVTGSDYQQFTKLPSAKAGKLSGDRIIRTFPGGEQHLIITEHGFRQEIRVDKLKFPLERFIASRSGKLPNEFKESPLTAVDANGETYVFTGDVKAFGDWLDKAKYPVVIDPDFTGQEQDRRIYGGGTYITFAVARSTSAAQDTTMDVGVYHSGLYVFVERLYMKYNTSSIDDGATVTQVNMTMTCIKDTTAVDTDIQIAKYIWSSFDADPTNATVREAAYDGLLAADSDDAIWRNTSGMSVNTPYTSGNLSTAWVNKTGITYYGLLSSHDKNNSEPTDNSLITLADASNATVAYRPTLSVTYSVPPTGGHSPLYENIFNSEILNSRIVR